MINTRVAKLLAGQKAPDFTTVDVLKNKIAVRDIDARYVLLVFFRYAGCPWCNLAIHRLSLEYSTLKNNGCEVIAFIQSDARAITANIYDRHAQKPKFSIIADPKREYYNLYGVGESLKAAVSSIKNVPFWLHSVKEHGYKQTQVDGNLFLVPASFLIDTRTNTIIQTSYGTSYYDTEAFMDIYQSVFYKEL